MLACDSIETSALKWQAYHFYIQISESGISWVFSLSCYVHVVKCLKPDRARPVTKGIVCVYCIVRGISTISNNLVHAQQVFIGTADWVDILQLNTYRLSKCHKSHWV